MLAAVPALDVREGTERFSSEERHGAEYVARWEVKRKCDM